MPANELTDTMRFAEFRIPHSTFRIQKGTFISGHYLRPGDLLWVEAISPDLLFEAARLAAQADLADDVAVAFFHLDTAIVHRYPVQLLDNVCAHKFSRKKNRCEAQPQPSPTGGGRECSWQCVISSRWGGRGRG
jgi:hypothetical protein